MKSTSKLRYSAVMFLLLSSTAASTTWATEQGNTEHKTTTNIFLEVRERIEHQENFNDKFYGINPKLGEAADTYLLSRIRLGLTHQFTEQFSGKISLQDSRAIDWAFDDAAWKNSEFGGMVNNPQDDPLELGETWLQYKNDWFTAKAGRQAIHYGNNRVFGPGAWKNSGKWVWDAIKASYNSGENWLDAFYGESMLHDPDVFSLDHRHGYTSAGVYGHVQTTDFLAVEPILVTKYNDSSNDYAEKNLLYYGARLLLKLAGKLDGFTADATYVQQTGEVTADNGGQTDSDAYGCNLDLQYRFNPQWAVGTTYSFATGDDKATPDNERFDGVYGASDKYYGLMNLMTWSNLLDYGVLINFLPKKNIVLQIEYHQFYADQIDDKWRSYKNGLDAESDHYGNEIDLVTKWKLTPTWKFRAGASVFMPGNAIEEAVAGGQDFISDETAYSGFFQVTYTFNKEL
ncbi:Alginate export [Candidatus Electrothrix aarhusensis]|uniref:Alginate export n=1 Tax=Candidatus Electrothrix aarhusensis TaxID=1859131 RepID=A0A3S3RRI6_9BACT|nr:Alginate export [Candidatus Electrothrix aarhusensis]